MLSYGKFKYITENRIQIGIAVVEISVYKEGATRQTNKNS